jgi:hypothetical protein
LNWRNALDVGFVMGTAPISKENKGKGKFRWLPELDRLLIVGIKNGAATKHDAINKILNLVPELTRGDCWRRVRHLRRTPELAALQQNHESNPSQAPRGYAVHRRASRPWTAADDDRLLNWAGYEPVAKIAQRLGRSERAVRFRMGALGMSAKVTDGWSLRALRKMLRVSPTRLRFLIGNGMLRVRDSRVSAASLKVFFDRQRASLDSIAVERITTAIEKGDDTYSWDRAAELLDVGVEAVQSLISSGQLKVVDPFVTDRQFEEFCKKHGDEFNMALIDPATAKWLVSEYGVKKSAVNGRTATRAQKHALITRACKCGKKIAGNAYFRHVRACQPAATPIIRRDSNEDSGRQLWAS